MAEGASRNAGLLRRFSTRLRTVRITAGIGHTTDAKEPKWLTDRLLSGDAELPLWVVHGRPRFAKHSFYDQQKVKIAPVHPDFGAAVTATVPDGIC
jgi:hypothetical protein